MAGERDATASNGDRVNGGGPGAPVPDLADVERLTGALTAEWLEQHAMFPMAMGDGVVIVGTWSDDDDIDPLALDDLRLTLGAPVRLERLGEHELRSAIRRVYAPDAVTAEGLIAGLTNGESRGQGVDEIPLDDLLHLANEAPVVRLVNLLLIEALEARASDVHLEGYADGLRVRYRVDGVLQAAPSPPPHLTAAIISRLKIMAELDIAERRLPQDGRIRLRLQNRQVDVRVSTVPTLRGESVVLRLLDKEKGRITLPELGMAEDTLELFREVISRPHGIVLSTGPTGSGKTTTLYAALEMLRTGREKILTVEDPVEYELPGVPQVPVKMRRRSASRSRARCARCCARGSGHHSRRGNPRSGNGADRHAGRADRPPCVVDAPHERRADRAHAPARPRCRGVSGREHRRCRARAASRPRDLPALQSPDSAGCNRATPTRHRLARPHDRLERRGMRSVPADRHGYRGRTRCMH